MWLVLTDAVKSWGIVYEMFTQMWSLPQVMSVLLNLPKKMLLQLTQ